MFISVNSELDMRRPLGRAILPGDSTEFARSLHARLLHTAAARRLRSLERVGSGRTEDADYWKQCAPQAVRKAAEVRRSAGLSRLP